MTGNEVALYALAIWTVAVILVTAFAVALVNLTDEDEDQ